MHKRRALFLEIKAVTHTSAPYRAIDRTAPMYSRLVTALALLKLDKNRSRVEAVSTSFGANTILMIKADVGLKGNDRAGKLSKSVTEIHKRRSVYDLRPVLSKLTRQGLHSK